MGKFVEGRRLNELEGRKVMVVGYFCFMCILDGKGLGCYCLPLILTFFSLSLSSLWQGEDLVPEPQIQVQEDVEKR